MVTLILKAIVIISMLALSILVNGWLMLTIADNYYEYKRKRERDKYNQKIYELQIQEIQERLGEKGE